MMRMTAWQRTSGSYRAAILFLTSAHPHCLCHLALVYPSEIEGKTAKDRIKAGGDEWLEKKTYAERCEVLGIKGANTWEKGGDWRRYMRGWSSKNAKSRLTVEMMRRKIAEDRHEVIDKALLNKLLAPFTRSGGIVQCDEATQYHLMKMGAEAVFLAANDQGRGGERSDNRSKDERKKNEHLLFYCEKTQLYLRYWRKSIMQGRTDKICMVN